MLEGKIGPMSSRKRRIGLTTNSTHFKLWGPDIELWDGDMLDCGTGVLTKRQSENWCFVCSQLVRGMPKWVCFWNSSLTSENCFFPAAPPDAILQRKCTSSALAVERVKVLEPPVELTFRVNILAAMMLHQFGAQFWHLLQDEVR